MKISSAPYYLSEIQDIAKVCTVQQDMMKISIALHYLSEIQNITEAFLYLFVIVRRADKCITSCHNTVPGDVYVLKQRVLTIWLPPL